MKCESCGKEFEPKRKNQKYCYPGCKRFMKDFYGGKVTRKGNTTKVTGGLNCMMFMRGMK